MEVLLLKRSFHIKNKKYDVFTWFDVDLVPAVSQTSQVQPINFYYYFADFDKSNKF